MATIVLASGNSGKLKEIHHYLAQCNFKIIPQSDFSVPSIEETGLTFVENAILKARHAAKFTGLPSIADDSGLEVDALKGEPGVFSARYAGKNATDADNNKKLLSALMDVPMEQRTARFQSVIVYVRSAQDPRPIICQGTWEGHILLQPQGKNGFGYDPLFYVPTHQCSAAQLPLAIKNQISHRAQALHQLLQYFQTDKSLYSNSH